LLFEQTVFKVANGKTREDHVVSRGRGAAMLKEMLELEGSSLLFVVNFQVPGDPPLSMIHVYAIPPASTNPPSPRGFYKTFDKFWDFNNVPVEVAADEQELEEERFLGMGAARQGDVTPLVQPDAGKGEFPLEDFKNMRFKLIPSIVDGPAAVKWAVGTKPTILGQKVSTSGFQERIANWQACSMFFDGFVMDNQVTQRYFKGGRYCEVDVDIGSSVIASQVCEMT